MISTSLCWKRSIINQGFEHRAIGFRQLVQHYWPDLDLQAALDPSLWPCSLQPPWPTLSRCPQRTCPACQAIPLAPILSLLNPQDMLVESRHGGHIASDSSLGGERGRLQGMCIQQAQCFTLY